MGTPRISNADHIRHALLKFEKAVVNNTRYGQYSSQEEEIKIRNELRQARDELEKLLGIKVYGGNEK